MSAHHRGWAGLLVTMLAIYALIALNYAHATGASTAENVQLDSWFNSSEFDYLSSSSYGNDTKVNYWKKWFVPASITVGILYVLIIVVSVVIGTVYFVIKLPKEIAAKLSNVTLTKIEKKKKKQNQSDDGCAECCEECIDACCCLCCCGYPNSGYTYHGYYCTSAGAPYNPWFDVWFWWVWMTPPQQQSCANLLCCCRFCGDCSGCSGCDCGDAKCDGDGAGVVIIAIIILVIVAVSLAILTAALILFIERLILIQIFTEREMRNKYFALVQATTTSV